MLGGPGCYVLEPTLPVCDGEVVVVEPGIAVCIVAAPLGFADVHVRVDVNVLGQGNLGDVVPDLEAGSVFVEGWVFCYNLVGDLCAFVDVSI